MAVSGEQNSDIMSGGSDLLLGLLNVGFVKVKLVLVCQKTAIALNIYDHSELTLVWVGYIGDNLVGH